MFAIVVEMWGMGDEDPYDLEYVGEFLWSSGFATGEVHIWNTPQEALLFLSDNEKKSSFSGFDYRYHLAEVDVSDGVFRREQDIWE
jgi:hypothetical protein